ncbi:unnamed protein product [Phytophthora fragariaefolia]|uniref:Unnamed protein product n=1 Tax=Phytophthora fragariaefolia TaxID=1490495 RepID=A0A9W7CVI5_9STRA|nr:unnamed protein product [Phytophthora fragariaefolia]
MHITTTIAHFKTTQEALLRSEMKTWSSKTQDEVCNSMQSILDRETKQQTEVLKGIDLQIKLCCEAIEDQRKRMDVCQVEVEKQVRETIATNREDIARQCSEAHGRIDYQFRTQEETFARLLGEQHTLREEFMATGSRKSEQIAAHIAAAIEELDRRILDREHQELEKMYHRSTEEVQLRIANAFKALEPAKVREQRKLRQHQHVVGRKLAELDQMLQLIGRQLIQNTSQLQVVRNEQLVHNFQFSVEDEGAEYDDDEFLLQYDSIGENGVLSEVPLTPAFSSPQLNDQNGIAISGNTLRVDREDTPELQARRFQHQELQQQLNRKLQDYSQVLNARLQEAKEGEAKLAQPTQPPKE